MADSDVDIANMTLTLLGEAPITSLDDELDAARAIKRLYTICLDAHPAPSAPSQGRRRLFAAASRPV